MTFRIEEKLFLNTNQIHEFKKWINSKNSKKIYNNRIVRSIYFENNVDQMFGDSEEGCVPRKKIRVRNYPNNNYSKDYFLEVKISSVEGRFKTNKKINQEYLNNINRYGYTDQYYGVCFPKLEINYLREYYKVMNSRITIYSNIFYKDYKDSHLLNRDKVTIVEIKSNINTDLNKLYCDFPFQRVRFSKYCRGYISLYG